MEMRQVQDMRQSGECTVRWGVVESIQGSVAGVRVVQNDACSQCRISQGCHTNAHGREIVVSVPVVKGLSVGQRVLLSGTVGQGMKAVVLAFVIPLVLILVITVACAVADSPKGVAETADLLGLVLYYVVLALFRRRLKDMFGFRIERCLNQKETLSESARN